MQFLLEAILLGRYMWVSKMPFLLLWGKYGASIIGLWLDKSCLVWSVRAEVTKPNYHISRSLVWRSEWSFKCFSWRVTNYNGHHELANWKERNKAGLIGEKPNVDATISKIRLSIEQIIESRKGLLQLSIFPQQHNNLQVNILDGLFRVQNTSKLTLIVHTTNNKSCGSGWCDKKSLRQFKEFSDTRLLLLKQKP